MTDRHDPTPPTNRRSVREAAIRLQKSYPDSRCARLVLVNERMLDDARTLAQYVSSLFPFPSERHPWPTEVSDASRELRQAANGIRVTRRITNENFDRPVYEAFDQETRRVLFRAEGNEKFVRAATALSDFLKTRGLAIRKKM